MTTGALEGCGLAWGRKAQRRAGDRGCRLGGGGSGVPWWVWMQIVSGPPGARVDGANGMCVQLEACEGGLRRRARCCGCGKISGCGRSLWPLVPRWGQTRSHSDLPRTSWTLRLRRPDGAGETSRGRQGARARQQHLGARHYCIGAAPFPHPINHTLQCTHHYTASDYCTTLHTRLQGGVVSDWHTRKHTQIYTYTHVLPHLPNMHTPM